METNQSQKAIRALQKGSRLKLTVHPTKFHVKEVPEFHVNLGGSAALNLTWNSGKVLSQILRMVHVKGHSRSRLTP